jgi:hypothetical protein
MSNSSTKTGQSCPVAELARIYEDLSDDMGDRAAAIRRAIAQTRATSIEGVIPQMIELDGAADLITANPTVAAAIKEQDLEEQAQLLIKLPDMIMDTLKALIAAA